LFPLEREVRLAVGHQGRQLCGWWQTPAEIKPLPESLALRERTLVLLAASDILEVSEIQAIVAELQLREHVLLFLDMATL
jgi:hypothetical protein